MNNPVVDTWQISDDLSSFSHYLDGLCNTHDQKNTAQRRLYDLRRQVEVLGLEYERMKRAEDNPTI